MAIKTTGKCLCGAVTYEVEIPDKPFYSGLCHCRDCQRYTGTAFASSLMVDKGGVKLKGKLKFYGKETDRGTFMERGFCPKCGSNVLCKSSDWDNQYVISAGTLDDPSRVGALIFSAWYQNPPSEKMKRIRWQIYI